MADILCPLCGKPTPEEQDNCQHCQAPLKDFASTATPAGDDQLPEWLRELQASKPATPQEPTPTEEPAPLETDLPDWLLQSAAPSEIIPSSEAGMEPPQAPAAGDETPAWLDGLLPASQKPALPDEVIPDWLAEMSGTAETSAPPGEQPEAPPEPAELPDWLARLQQQSSEKPTSSVPAFTFDDEESPPEEQAGTDDHMLSTLPEWVSQITAEQPEEPAAEPEPGLAPAELPGWLEAMRPLESVSPTAPLEDLSTAETVAAGPLIGLRGVLSAEPDAIRAHKPAAQGLKLRITDEQRARLALLEELMAGEQKPKPLPPSPTITPQYLFRLVIALVLLLPILWIVISQTYLTPLPVGEEQLTVMEFDTAVRKLNEGDPVLLAIDYEAGFTGEMELAANVVLSRLVEQGAYLVMVSTNTAGPALSERLLTTLNNTLKDPYPGTANLGYLPAGAMGLAELIQRPRQLLPYTLAGTQPWEDAPLNTVSTLVDFGMVMVFANDADTVRSWVEQTGPALHAANVPLLLVVSAQAEPLVRPYTQGAAPLVKALLAGLPDSAAYENMTTRYSPGRHEIWDAFSLTLPIAALIILAGNLAGAVITAIRQGQPGARSAPPPGRKTGQTQERP